MTRVLCLLAACGSSPAAPDASPQAIDSMLRAIDARNLDAAASRCDPTAAFGAPVALDALNSTADDDAVWLGHDERTAYLSSQRDGDRDIYLATRASRDDAFGTPAAVAGVNTQEEEARPTLSDDGLAMFAGQFINNWKIVVATRADTTSDFGTLTFDQNVNDPDLSTYDSEVYPLPSGAAYLSSARDGGAGFTDLYRTTWDGTSFTTPVAVAGTNTSFAEGMPVATIDDLHLFFASDRAGNANFDIYEASRADTSADFDTPVLVTELSTDTTSELPSWISDDGCVMYLSRDGDLYVAQRGS